jgi:hypothetical protein
MLEDQGVDEGARRQVAEELEASPPEQLVEEQVGPAPLELHAVDLAAADGPAVELDDDGVGSARDAALEVAGEGDVHGEGDHGQDRQDGEHLALVASEDRERHGSLDRMEAAVAVRRGVGTGRRCPLGPGTPPGYPLDRPQIR